MYSRKGSIKMIRNFYTDKLMIGGIVFLIIFAVSCVQYELEPFIEEKQEITNTQEAVKTDSKTTPVTDTPVESITPTAEKLIPPTSDVTNNADEDDFVLAEEPVENVPVSPFGFGPYPEVPADYFGDPTWARNPNHLSEFTDDASKNIELIERVLIKLWQQGDKAIVGGSTHNGKVYPLYANVLYVRWKEGALPDGGVYHYISRVLGGNDGEVTTEDIESGNIPDNFKIVDFDDAGIDPYEFLNLKRTEE